MCKIILNLTNEGLRLPIRKIQANRKVIAKILVGVGFVLLTLAAIGLGQGRAFLRAGTIEWWMWAGGALGAFYVWTMVWSLPRLGALTALCALALGQILAAILLDRTGAFGLPLRGSR